MPAASAPKPSHIMEVPQHLPASEVKQRGWRGVMRTLQQRGTVVVTNHNRPEAVILGIEQYDALKQAAGLGERRVETALEDLSRDFDKRLSALQDKDAGDRLRAAMRKPAKLHGKVRAAQKP